MNYTVKITSLTFLLALTAACGFGQYESSDASLEKIILHHDSLFWTAYNNCDVGSMAIYFTDDFEFYHDKAGLTTSKTAMVESIQNGLCNSSDWRIKREALEGTIEIFPLEGYGGIISGEHVFYIIENNGEPYLDGIAKFTHVWKNQNDRWEMSRALSYNHHEASAEYMGQKEVLGISQDHLTKLAGSYNAPQSGEVLISLSDGTLRIEVGKMNQLIYADSKYVFSNPQNQLSFEFMPNSDGEIVKIIVRENGETIEEAKRMN